MILVVTENAQYRYCPSLGAAILFAILFGLSALAHFTQAIIYRKRFCWCIVMACSWECTGFLLRAISTRDINSAQFAFPSQLFVLLSPLWINAFDYMVLGRIVYCFLPAKKIYGIPASRLALYFVLLDITSFVIQAAGGLLGNSKDPKTLQLGLHIYMGGIAFQEVFVVVFIGLAIKLYRELNALGSTEWKPLLRVLLVTLALITIRIIYRFTEFSMGVESKLTDNEIYFYALEATPMVLAVALFNAFHPGQFLIGPDSEFPKKNSEKRKRIYVRSAPGDALVLETV
ncbi:RTA1 like protein-domain-containing protein [Mycena floridula]|nr:RTA1 like protein-domain-containing protein [Mycena floridula]